MQVYLNPRDMVCRFTFQKKFGDQTAYAPVQDVKIEVYDAIVRWLEANPDLDHSSILATLQARRSDIHAGVVDG